MAFKMGIARKYRTIGINLTMNEEKGKREQKDEEKMPAVITEFFFFLSRIDVVVEVIRAFIRKDLEVFIDIATYMNKDVDNHTNLVSHSNGETPYN